MSATALRALRALGSVLALDSPPREAREWIAEICVAQGWASATESALIAERLEAPFLTRARREHNAAYAAGRLPDFAFNSSSETKLQGACFVETDDDPAVREAKTKRLALNDYAAALLQLSPDDFEVLCRGLLGLIGVADPKVTRRSADEGIDFYGRWDVGGTMQPLTELPGAHRLLQVWLVGQAKRYDAVQAATPDIRELVGSVTLARAKAYSRPKDPYPDMTLRPCDPVFFMFATSGSISSDCWELLRQSGVIGLDGNMVAALLADHSVAQVSGQFDEAELQNWLEAQRPAS